MHVTAYVYIQYFQITLIKKKHDLSIAIFNLKLAKEQQSKQAC